MPAHVVEYGWSIENPPAAEAFGFLCRSIYRVNKPSKEMTENFVRPDSTFYGYMDDDSGEIVGAALVDSKNHRHRVLDLIAIESGRRGKGEGGIFLGELEERLSNDGAVTLSAVPISPESVKLFRTHEYGPLGDLGFMVIKVIAAQDPVSE